MFIEFVFIEFFSLIFGAHACMHQLLYHVYNYCHAW